MFEVKKSMKRRAACSPLGATNAGKFLEETAVCSSSQSPKSCLYIIDRRIVAKAVQGWTGCQRLLHLDFAAGEVVGKPIAVAVDLEFQFQGRPLRL